MAETLGVPYHPGAGDLGHHRRSFGGKNYDIAMAMLTHYGKLKNLSLAEIADLCYVSKASISRFCRFMGFDGFRELHDCLLQDFSIGTDYSRAFFDKLCDAPQAALQDYSEELIRNIRVTTAPENTARLPDMAMALANSGRVAFFSHHFLWDIGGICKAR